MARWPIVGQFTIAADTPDEAIAWLKNELARRLESGAVRDDPGVPVGQRA